MAFVSSSGGDRDFSAPQSERAFAPPRDGALDSLRALYDQAGRCAVAVAEALTSDAAIAQQVVIDAFSAVRRAPITRDDAPARRLVLKNAVGLCEQRRQEEHGAPSGSWGELRADQRVALALAVRGGCSVAEIAEILDADRAEVSRMLTDGLRSAQQLVATRLADSTDPDGNGRTG